METSAGTGVTVKPLYGHKNSPLVLPLYPRNIKHLQLCPQAADTQRISVDEHLVVLPFYTF